MDATQILFYCLLLLVAFLYASVGHGGASGYLALMALFAVPPVVMKPTALVLNLFVSAVSFIQFYRAQHFRKEICWPLVAASIPASFIGGMITVQAGLYKKILGVVLLISVARFLMPSGKDKGTLKESNRTALFVIGGVIGFLSGLIGIGGGIILSPILLLLRWTNMKQTAAISAIFIFLNSVAGLLGQLAKSSISFTPSMVAYVGIALVGGLAGAYLGAAKFKQGVLKYILAGVLLLAVFKLLFTNA
jgi:uncharacterized membrane protein YfcA